MLWGFWRIGEIGTNLGNFLMKGKMKRPIEIFSMREKGILNIIRAADIYFIHIITKARNEEPYMNVVNAIINEKKISGFNVLGELYNDKEMKMLNEEEHVKHIGQQILLSSYAALEFYLIEKFKEYYRFILKEKNSSIVEGALKRFSFRSMEEIKKLYYEMLSIHLPSFDVRYDSHEKSAFQPKISWDAIILLAKARNEIAHQGETSSYKIVTLMDYWYPFDFIRRWVGGFDVNFDLLIYEGRKTNLVKAHDKRVRNSLYCVGNERDR